MRVLQRAYEIEGVKFKGPATYIHHDAFIDNIGDLEIGENVVISTKAILLAHDYSVLVKEKVLKQYGISTNVPPPISYLKIGNNVFIGAGAVILPKSTIGDYCIIGAGAVVKGDIPDYSVVIGNPCQIIKSLKPENVTAVTKL